MDEKTKLTVYRKFYETWIRCESNRGCYSCCPKHDSRCLQDRGIGACTCWRDDVNILEKAIDEMEAR